MLEATNLTKRYDGGHTALDSLNLSIAPGEVFCLLGANGAGKTTTINLFLNFVPPTSGTARINGLDVVQQPLETKRFLAYIPEQVMLYRNLTGLENLEYFAALAGGSHAPDRLRRFLTDAGLPEGAADKRVSTYSKGMRQKVGIAIAMAKDAKALLLDEPTSGLDPNQIRGVRGLIRELGKSKTILVSTHILQEVDPVADRVLFIHDGKLVFDGKPSELRAEGRTLEDQFHRLTAQPV